MSEPRLDTAEEVIGYGMFRAAVQPPPGTAQVIMATLADYGYAIIKLAEPVTIDWDGRQVFSEGSDAGTVEVDPESGVIYNDLWEWTSDDAMEVGRQWISGALVAGPNRTVKQ